MNRIVDPALAFHIVHYHLGLALKAAGKTSEAGRAAERSIELGESDLPDAVEARHELDSCIRWRPS